MSTFISHIATVEIPVTNLKNSIEFYKEILGIEVYFEGVKAAMLAFHQKGIPTIYLVETEEVSGLSFVNSHSEIEHSVIDFYTSSLQDFYLWLNDKNIDVGPLNIHAENGLGGFGFKDLDGNLIGVTNVLHPGQ